MGSKSSGDIESTQEAVPWSGAQPYLLDINRQAQGINNAGGAQYYPGQTYPGRDPLQDQAQNLSLNYATNSMPDQIYDAQRAQSFALNSPDAANNPYVQNMMRSNAFNLNRNLQENLLPAIDSGAVNAGAYGGSRQGIAQGLAMRGTQDALANANASTMMDAYSKGLGAQGMALGNAGNMMNMGLSPMNIMNQVGQYNQGIDQTALDADMARWNYNQQLPMETLNFYNNIIQGNNAWGSQSTQDGGGSSPLSGAIGGGLLGYSATPAITSMLGGSVAGAAVAPWATLGGALLGGLL
jgi:hypothetical protein